MLRLARILLLDPRTSRRRELERALEGAGHEVVAVPAAAAARRLVAEGLDPDVVLADPEVLADDPGVIAAGATVVELPEGEEGADAAGPALRRIEEVLLARSPRAPRDDAARCLDLARRLASSLPGTRSPERRVELVTEAFDAFFGVAGTLVVRRGPGADEWIEVSRGIEPALAGAVSAEIAERASHRGLRPFLARLCPEGGTEVRDVAGAAVRIGPVETDLALVLERAPRAPALRETLASLVGSALRASMTADELDETRAELAAVGASFESLLAVSRELAAVGDRARLCERILRAVERELGMTRAALFLPRGGGAGMLRLAAATGFPPRVLERIGLSAFHGVGAECVGTDGPRRLATVASTGAAERELALLGEASLQWARGLRAGTRGDGLLLFGNRDELPELDARERRVLEALVEAAETALGALERFESLRDVSVTALRGLVAAVELRHPSDRGHAERTARAAVRLGRALGLDARALRDLALAAMLHDVGKAAAEDARGGAAAGTTARARRLHPVLGSRILSSARPSPSVVQAVEQHHERWDGLGFPYGLRGESICLFGRILSIANAWDRISGTDAPAAPEQALRRLERGAGLLHDPGLVAVFASDVGRTPDPSANPDGAWLEEILGAV